MVKRDCKIIVIVDVVPQEKNTFNKILCRNLSNQGKISRIGISQSGTKGEVGEGSNDE